MADPPICKTCNTAHWPFRKQDCLGPPAAEPEASSDGPDPTTAAPSMVTTGPLPEGLHQPSGFGKVDRDSFAESAAALGFGGGEAGWRRPPRRS